MGTGYFGTMVTPSLYAEFEILVLESAALIPLLPLGDFCSSELLCPHFQILAAPYCNKFGLEAQRKESQNVLLCARSYISADKAAKHLATLGVAVYFRRQNSRVVGNDRRA